MMPNIPLESTSLLIDGLSFYYFCWVVKQLVPAMKDKWLMTVEYLEPHLKLASSKTVEAYEALKTNMKPHVMKVQELTDPYYQVTYITFSYLDNKLMH